MTTPALTLKPCPHCGQPARLVKDTFKPGYFVGCSNELDCEVWTVTHTKPTEADAVQAWENNETR